MRGSVAWWWVLAALIASSSCILFKPPEETVAIDVPPAERFKVSLRFALLVPFEKVAAAARSEFKVEGGEEEGQQGESDIVHFKLTEAQLKAAAKGSSQSLENSSAAGGGDANRDDMELRLWQEPNVLVAQVRFRKSGTDEKEKEESRKRAKKIFKILATLPGVGPAVDRDGVPRDSQFNVTTIPDQQDGGGGNAIDVNPALLGGDAGAADAAKTTTANAPTDAGTKDAATTTDAGKDAGKRP